MEILETQIYRGPNYWAPVPVIRFVLGVDDFEKRLSSQIPGFGEKLSAIVPTLCKHFCSAGGPRGFFQRISEGVDLFHVAQHTGLELQILAGQNISYGKAHADCEETETRTHHFMLPYEEAEVGVAAGALAIRLQQSLLRPEDDPDFDFASQLAELIQLAKDLRPGIDTRKLKEEAESRGIPVEYLDENRTCPRAGSGSRRRLSIMQLGQGKFQKRIWAPYVSTDSFISAEIASNKELTSRLLRSAGLPVPRSISVTDEDSAITAAREIGYPVVVKPLDGSQGRGVGVYLRNEAAVRAHYPLAVRETQSGTVLVEKFISGCHYRILVVGGRFVAAAERLPAHVTGDGSHTLRELVELSNADPTRAVKHKTRIAFDERAIALAETQDYRPEDIPPRGARVHLVLTCNISTGGTSIDCTDEIHADNVEICKHAARVVGLDIAGIDLITPNITKSALETGGAICEVNGGPGLFVVHSQPVAGMPRDVISPVIDHLFPPGTASRVPIVAITGTNGTKIVSQLIAHIVKLAGYSVGAATTEGVDINGVRIVRGDMSGSDAARTVLRNPSIDAAVLETGYKGILCSGLGYDHADVAVITNIGSERTISDSMDTPHTARLNFVVARAVSQRGVTVLNADDECCVRIGKEIPGEVIYFSLQPENEAIGRHLQAGGCALTLYPRAEGKTISLINHSQAIVPILEIHAAEEGRHELKIVSALAAAAACVGLGVNLECIREGLHTFAQG